MAEKFEKWREADRLAHHAELWVRSLPRRTGYSEHSQRADIQRAKDLRAQADSLFHEAMHEMSSEVNRALQRDRADKPDWAR